MKIQIEIIKSWWQQRTSREQVFSVIGALCLLVSFIYLGLWSPWHNHLVQLKNQVSQQYVLLNWMKQVWQNYDQTANAASHSERVQPDQLLSFVSESLKQPQLNGQLSHLEQITDKKVKLEFDSVSFDSLIKWLTNIQEQNNISGEQLTFSALDTPGKVKASVVLVVIP